MTSSFELAPTSALLCYALCPSFKPTVPAHSKASMPGTRASLSAHLTKLSVSRRIKNSLLVLFNSPTRLLFFLYVLVSFSVNV